MRRATLLLGALAALFLLSLSPAFAARGDLIDVSKIQNSVRISLGQKAVVAFDLHGDKLANPRRVQGAQKGPVVTLEFFADKVNKELLVLVIGSSYPRVVRYRAAARQKGRREFYETNVLRLNPKIPVFEGWSDPFEELVLFDFKLTNEKPIQ